MSQIGYVPPTTVQRLPVYLRCLILAQSQRREVLNSAQIADMAGTNGAQVRKDLSYLGEYGVRGLGYDVDSLVAHLVRWLGLEKTRRAAIVGFGRLGSALRNYGGFQDRGISVVAVFDADPDKIGSKTGDVTIESTEHLSEAIARENVEIAMLTVPASVAEEVSAEVIAGGVKAILNFAPVHLEVPDGVVVRQADLAADLQILSFHLSEAERART